MSSTQPPFSPRSEVDPSPSLTVRRLVLLVASLLVGVALGLALIAVVFPSVPTDVRRLGVVFEALRSRTPAPEIVVFGNSILMSGIDARALSRELPGEPLAWNCASPGQTALEAYLLSQNLPARVDVVIYGFMVTVGDDGVDLHPQKYNTLFMYGYRPTSRTVDVVGQTFGRHTRELLERSWISQAFTARWAIRQFVDTEARSILRPDLALERATFDLFKPQGYERPIDPAITARLVAARLAAFQQSAPDVSDGTLSLARHMVREAAEAGRETVFLFPPLHPEILRHQGKAIREAIDRFEESLVTGPDVAVIDASDLLDAEHFIDDLHPTNAGAKILTMHVARLIEPGR